MQANNQEVSNLEDNVTKKTLGMIQFSGVVATDIL